MCSMAMGMFGGILAYDAVENFMDRLSDAVSDQDRALSLPLARRVLEEMSDATGEDEAEG